MIEPTIGRMLWYWPDAGKGDPMPANPHLPYTAVLAGIQGSRLLNLAVVSHGGYWFTKQGVRLLDDDKGEGAELGCAQWMPYQLGQAKKQDDGRIEALERRLADLEQDNAARNHPGSPPAERPPSEPYPGPYGAGNSFAPGVVTDPNDPVQRQGDGDPKFGAFLNKPNADDHDHAATTDTAGG